MAEKLLTMREAASKLGISYQYLRLLVSKGETRNLPPSIMVGNCRRFPESKLDFWIEHTAG